MGGTAPLTCGCRRVADVGGCMISKLIGLAAALALPSVLAAQTPTIPNDHASPQGQAMVTAHSKGAQHRATQRRGEVAGGLSHRPGWIATPPVGRAVPEAGGVSPPPAPPTGSPPHIAVAAPPPPKTASPGQSRSHRPSDGRGTAV